MIGDIAPTAGDQIAADFYIYTDMGRDIVTIFDIQRPLFRVDDFTALKASDSEDGPDAASSILLSFGYYDRRDKDVCAAPDTGKLVKLLLKMLSLFAGLIVFVGFWIFFVVTNFSVFYECTYVRTWYSLAPDW